MKFYNRKQEIEAIHHIIKKGESNGQLIVLQGKRRIGKTALILHSLKTHGFLYFFVSRKTSKELLFDWQEEIINKLQLAYPIHFSTFKDFFQFIFEYSKQNTLLVVFDEFQNFKFIEPSVFSELQKYWDINKNQSRISIFCIGSLFTLMKKIFTSNKEPLYNRANKIITLKSFSLSTQIQILRDFKIVSAKNALICYALFNGVPKYYEYIEDVMLEKDISTIIKKLYCEENAPLVHEGKNILIEEFGNMYDKYFSILTAIASGKTTKNEIHNYTGININTMGVFLEKLENFYEVIERRTPVLEKKALSKLSSYRITDKFFSFWFRYLYKKNYLVEIKNWSSLHRYIMRDLDNYLGFAFEDFIKQYFIENNTADFFFPFDHLGSFWKRPSANFDNREIDVVAVNTENKTVLIGECKIGENHIHQALIDKMKHNAALIKKVSQFKKIFYIFTVEKISVGKMELLKKNNVAALSIEEIIYNSNNIAAIQGKTTVASL